MNGHGQGSSAHIEEELDQIRRYEDFTTTGTFQTNAIPA